MVVSFSLARLPRRDHRRPLRPADARVVFAVMLAWGMELERITLGALILSLGLLVDDAIIAIEAMAVKLEQGWDRVRAATFAWSSTAFPMLSGTLVTVAGFLPVGFAASTAGEYRAASSGWSASRWSPPGSSLWCSPPISA